MIQAWRMYGTIYFINIDYSNTPFPVYSVYLLLIVTLQHWIRDALAAGEYATLGGRPRLAPLPNIGDTKPFVFKTPK